MHFQTSKQPQGWPPHALGPASGLSLACPPQWGHHQSRLYTGPANPTPQPCPCHWSAVRWAESFLSKSVHIKGSCALPWPLPVAVHAKWTVLIRWTGWRGQGRWQPWERTVPLRHPEAQASQRGHVELRLASISPPLFFFEVPHRGDGA